jgi:ATP-dependent protease ClpP protease subunit
MKGVIGYDITSEKLLQMINPNSTEKLQILINSSGGNVVEAFEIYNILESYKGQIEFVILPYAASAASYITMAGDKISAFKNSIWMAHRVTTFAIGNADDMQLQADIMRAIENIIIEAYQKRLKFTKDEMKEKLKNEIWLVGWEQLAENGIIDNVIDSVDEIYIEENYKEEINKSIEEASTSNAKQLVIMRMKKIDSQLKQSEINFKDEYTKIAAKIDIDSILNKENKYYNPYPNEHAARIRDPEEFQEDSFRRKKLEGAEGVSIIIGKLKGEDTTTTQAYRFSIENWTADEAKKWLKDHNIKYKSFEPATNEKKKSTADNSANDNLLNNREEITMTLTEFLEQNPEAKAEFDKAIESAIAKGRLESDARAEQSRIYNILEMAGVQMTKDVAAAIQNGVDENEFAKEELRRQRELRANNSAIDFGNLVKKQTPGEHDPEGKSKLQNIDKSIEEYDKASAAMAKKLFSEVV